MKVRWYRRLTGESGYAPGELTEEGFTVVETFDEALDKERELFGVPISEPIAWVPVIPLAILCGALIGSVLRWLAS